MQRVPVSGGNKNPNVDTNSDRMLNVSLTGLILKQQEKNADEPEHQKTKLIKTKT